MKLPFLPWLILGVAGVGISGAEDLPGPQIAATVEVEFHAHAGHSYVVEGSQDGTKWEMVAGPVVGEGSVHRAVVPAAAAGFREWRARQVSAAAFGPAVTSLGGKTVVLNEEGKPRQLIFFPSIQGVQRGVLKADSTHARSFVWKVERLNETSVSVELAFYDGSYSIVTLKFANNLLGAYESRDFSRDGAVRATDGGGFSLHEGRIRDEADEAVLPLTIDGRSLLFEEGGALTVMEFSNDGKVSVLRPDGSRETRQYRFEREDDAKASLYLESADSPVGPEVLQLALNSQATGGFNRLPLITPGGNPVPGMLPQPGTFNVPTTPTVSNSTTGPPGSLGGEVLQLNGDDPVTLTFNQDGTGTATRQEDGEVEVTPFTYDYSPTDDDEASLALTFPGAQTDRVEDYDLDFSSGSSGSYESSSYQNGELAQSSSGSFNSGGS